MVVASSARSRLITEATHQLESPRAGIMRGSKCSTTEAAHVLERVKDRQCLQQGPITAHHRSNSPMSQGQALWEGPNAAPQKPLTFCRAVLSWWKKKREGGRIRTCLEPYTKQNKHV